MYDLTFIEFSKRKAGEKRKEDVTSLWSEGCYDFDTPYFLFFLYELTDEDSFNFIANCGGSLNNLSSSNVTILTFFEKSMVSNWRNVQSRSKIVCGERGDSLKAASTLSELSARFQVSSLPALILVKKEESGDKSLLIPIKKANPSSMYGFFEAVIGIINSNCEEDFSYLSSKLVGEDSPRIEQDAFMDVGDASYLYNFLDEIRERKGYLKIADICDSLHICRKTFYNKRTKGTFTRDECLKLGVLLGLEDSKLNKLLRLNGQAELTLSEKDLEVREAIAEGESLEEVMIDLFGESPDR